MATISMPFGRHKGKSLAVVPADYLKWILDEADPQPWLKVAIESELVRREGKPAETSFPAVEEPVDEDLLSRRNQALTSAFAKEMQVVLWNKELVGRIVDSGEFNVKDPETKKVALAIKRVFGLEPFPQDRP